MPVPNYPHPTPDPNAAQYVVPHPTGAELTLLPDPGTLAANVQTWLNEVDPAAPPIKSWATLTKAGCVLIVGNAERNTPVPGYDRVEVLNGRVANVAYHAMHKEWRTANENWIKMRPKFAASTPDHLHVPSDIDVTSYAQDRNHGGTTDCYTDAEGKRIFINAHANRGDMLVHEYLHTCDPGDPNQLGWGVDEGMVDFFSRDIAKRFGYPYRGNGAYEGGYQMAKRLVDRVGLRLITRLWFQRSDALLRTFSEITLQATSLVIPGKEKEFEGNLGALNPLLDKFESTARGKFPSEVTVTH